MNLTTLIGRVGKVSEYPGTNNTPYLRIRLAVTIQQRNANPETQWWTVFSFNTNLFPFLKEGRLILVSGRATIDATAAADKKAEGQMSAAHIELLPESDMTFRTIVATMLRFDNPKDATPEEILNALSEDLGVPVPKPPVAPSRQTARSAAREQERQERRHAAGSGQKDNEQAGNAGNNADAGTAREPVGAGVAADPSTEGAGAAPSGGGRSSRGGRGSRAKSQGDAPNNGGQSGGEDDGPPFDA